MSVLNLRFRCFEVQSRQQHPNLIILWNANIYILFINWSHHSHVPKRKLRSRYFFLYPSWPTQLFFWRPCSCERLNYDYCAMFVKQVKKPVMLFFGGTLFLLSSRLRMHEVKRFRQVSPPCFARGGILMTQHRRWRSEELYFVTQEKPMKSNTLTEIVYLWPTC